jgi:endonuclease YncB( thermonuclease family)
MGERAEGKSRPDRRSLVPARVVGDLLVCENTIVRLPPRVRVLWLALALGTVAVLWWLPRPPAPAPVRVLEGRVVGVVDDETLRVAVADAEERVRYIAIAPHPAAGPAGGAAAAVSRELAEGRTVRLELDAQERDADGRLLAYVHVGPTMLNAELVRRGQAVVAAMPPNVRHDVTLLELQRRARESRRGLWASPRGPR